MIKVNQNQNPKRNRLSLKSDVLCHIWIMNHIGILRERYALYLQNAKMVTYMDKELNVVITEPDMSFEEYAVFMYEKAAFAIEHHCN